MILTVDQVKAAVINGHVHFALHHQCGAPCGAKTFWTFDGEQVGYHSFCTCKGGLGALPTPSWQAVADYVNSNQDRASDFGIDLPAGT